MNLLNKLFGKKVESNITTKFNEKLTWADSVRRNSIDLCVERILDMAIDGLLHQCDTDGVNKTMEIIDNTDMIYAAMKDYDGEHKYNAKNFKELVLESPSELYSTEDIIGMSLSRIGSERGFRVDNCYITEAGTDGPSNLLCITIVFN